LLSGTGKFVQHPAKILGKIAENAGDALQESAARMGAERGEVTVGPPEAPYETAIREAKAAQAAAGEGPQASAAVKAKGPDVSDTRMAELRNKFADSAASDDPRIQATVKAAQTPPEPGIVRARALRMVESTAKDVAKVKLSAAETKAATGLVAKGM